METRTVYPARVTSCQMPCSNVLSFHQGTHHLWSMPILSYQDITYHFRVSQSVSLLSLHFRSHGPDLLLVCLIIVSFFFSSRFGPCAFHSGWGELCLYERKLIVLWLPLPRPEPMYVGGGWGGRGGRGWFSLVCNGIEFHLITVYYFFVVAVFKVHTDSWVPTFPTCAFRYSTHFDHWNNRRRTEFKGCFFFVESL